MACGSLGYWSLYQRRYSLRQQVVFILKCCHNIHKLLITMSLVAIYKTDAASINYSTTHHLRHLPLSVRNFPPALLLKPIRSAPIHCHDIDDKQHGYNIAVHSIHCLRCGNCGLFWIPQKLWLCWLALLALIINIQWSWSWVATQLLLKWEAILQSAPLGSHFTERLLSEKLFHST